MGFAEPRSSTGDYWAAEERKMAAGTVVELEDRNVLANQCFWKPQKIPRLDCRNTLDKGGTAVGIGSVVSTLCPFDAKPRAWVLLAEDLVE